MRQRLANSAEDWIKIFGFLYGIAGFWIFLPPVIVGTSIYFLYVKFYTFAPLVSLYIAWFIYSKEWPETGCMKSDLFKRKSLVFRCGGDYFNYKFVKTVDLPTDRNYIFGSHPHGIACIGLILSYATSPAASESYPGIKLWAVTLAGQFLWPLRRELCMWGGVGASTKRCFQWIFGQEEKGQSIALVIGGLNEAIMTTPGRYYLKLLDRKGFVRIALTEGVDLVPAFHFGENETYRTVTGICKKRLRNAQAHIMNTFGFCPPLAMGGSLLGLPWGGLVPLKTRIETVVGGPIRVEKTPNPTEEEVNQLHATYCEKLIDLFETHKAKYGIAPEEKIILY